MYFVNDCGIILNKYGRFELYQEQIWELVAAGATIDTIGLQSHIHGEDLVDVKYHVDQLWDEFQLPILVTEFDWNAGNAVDMEDTHIMQNKCKTVISNANFMNDLLEK